MQPAIVSATIMYKPIGEDLVTINLAAYGDGCLRVSPIEARNELRARHLRLLGKSLLREADAIERTKQAGK